jgi:hypothetical protein
LNGVSKHDASWVSIVRWGTCSGNAAFGHRFRREFPVFVVT